MKGKGKGNPFAASATPIAAPPLPAQQTDLLNQVLQPQRGQRTSAKHAQTAPAAIPTLLSEGAALYWPEASIAVDQLWRQSGKTFRAKYGVTCDCVRGEWTPDMQGFSLEQGPKEMIVQLVYTPWKQKAIAFGGIIPARIYNHFSENLADLPPNVHYRFTRGVCKFPGLVAGYTDAQLIGDMGGTRARAIASAVVECGIPEEVALTMPPVAKEGGIVRFDSHLQFAESNPDILVTCLDLMQDHLRWMGEEALRRMAVPFKVTDLRATRGSLSVPLAWERSGNLLRFFQSPARMKDYLHPRGIAMSAWARNPRPMDVALTGWQTGMEGLALVHWLVYHEFLPRDAFVEAMLCLCETGELVSLFEMWAAANPTDLMLSRTKKTACRALRSAAYAKQKCERAVSVWQEDHSLQKWLAPVWAELALATEIPHPVLKALPQLPVSVRVICVACFEGLERGLQAHLKASTAATACIPQALGRTLSNADVLAFADVANGARQSLCPESEASCTRRSELEEEIQSQSVNLDDGYENVTQEQLDSLELLRKRLRELDAMEEDRVLLPQLPMSTVQLLACDLFQGTHVVCSRETAWQCRPGLRCSHCCGTEHFLARSVDVVDAALDVDSKLDVVPVPEDDAQDVSPQPDTPDGPSASTKAQRVEEAESGYRKKWGSSYLQSVVMPSGVVGALHKGKGLCSRSYFRKNATIRAWHSYSEVEKRPQFRVGWVEMKSYLGKAIEKATAFVGSMSSKETALHSWLWRSIGGSATRDVPAKLAGEAGDVRLCLLEGLARLHKEQPDAFGMIGELVNAIDEVEKCEVESLREVGIKARDVVLNMLWDESFRGRNDARIVTVQMIQALREGLKERLFELHSLCSQFLSRPAVRYLQKMLEQLNCSQAYLGQNDGEVAEYLRKTEPGWLIWSRDATLATDSQGKCPAMLYLGEVLTSLDSAHPATMLICRSLDHSLHELGKECHVHHKAELRDPELEKEYLARFHEQAAQGVLPRRYEQVRSRTQRKPTKAALAWDLVPEVRALWNQGGRPAMVRFVKGVIDEVNEAGQQNPPFNSESLGDFFVAVIEKLVDPSSTGHVLLEGRTGVGKSILFPLVCTRVFAGTTGVTNPRRTAVSTLKARQEHILKEYARIDTARERPQCTFGKPVLTVGMLSGDMKQDDRMKTRSNAGLVYLTEYFGARSFSGNLIHDEAHGMGPTLNAVISNARVSGGKKKVFMTATPPDELKRFERIEYMCYETYSGTQPPDYLQRNKVSTVKQFEQDVLDVLSWGDKGADPGARSLGKGETGVIFVSSYEHCYTLVKKFRARLEERGGTCVAVTGVSVIDQAHLPELYSPANPNGPTLIVGTNVIKESVTLPNVKVGWNFGREGGSLEAPLEGFSTVTSFAESVALRIQTEGRFCRNGQRGWLTTVEMKGKDGKARVLPSKTLGHTDSVEYVSALHGFGLSVADSVVPLGGSYEAAAKERLFLVKSCLEQPPSLETESGPSGYDLSAEGSQSKVLNDEMRSLGDLESMCPEAASLRNFALQDLPRAQCYLAYACLVEAKLPRSEEGPPPQDEEEEREQEEEREHDRFELGFDEDTYQEACREQTELRNAANSGPGQLKAFFSARIAWPNRDEGGDYEAQIAPTPMIKRMLERYRNLSLQWEEKHDIDISTQGAPVDSDDQRLFWRRLSRCLITYGTHKDRPLYGLLPGVRPAGYGLPVTGLSFPRVIQAGRAQCAIHLSHEDFCCSEADCIRDFGKNSKEIEVTFPESVPPVGVCSQAGQLKITDKAGMSGLSIVQPSFGQELWQSLSVDESIGALAKLRKRLTLGRRGKKIGTVNPWHQVPMSHIISFVILNGLTGFGFSSQGLLWARRVILQMTPEWQEELTEAVASWPCKGVYRKISFMEEDLPDESEILASDAGITYGDDGLYRGPPRLVNLARCAHILLGYLESTKGIMAEAVAGGTAQAELTERVFDVILPGEGEEEDLYSSGTQVHPAAVSRVPFVKCAAVAKQLKWVWSETTGSPSAAPRSTAIVHGAVERDALASLPEEVSLKLNKSLSCMTEVWQKKIQAVKDRLTKLGVKWMKDKPFADATDLPQLMDPVYEPDPTAAGQERFSGTFSFKKLENRIAAAANGASCPRVRGFLNSWIAEKKIDEKELNALEGGLQYIVMTSRGALWNTSVWMIMRKALLGKRSLVGSSEEDWLK